MLLGLSGLTVGDELDPANLAAGAGVEHGALLVDFVRELGRRRTDLADARTAVAGTLGDAAMVDAVAVYANFSMMTRIADGTGTPLDAGSVEMSADLRRGLELDTLVSRRLPT